MSRTLKFAIFLIIGTWTDAHAQAHECDAILQQGVRNTYKSLQTGNFAQNVFSKFCQDTKSSSSQGGSSEVGVGYKGFNFDYGSSSSESQSNAQKFCDEKSSNVSSNNLNDVLQLIADENIIKAWSECRSSASGLFITGEANGKTLIVEYRFRSAGAVATTTIDGNPSIIGASCDDAVKDGTVITTGGRSQICTRSGNEPVTIVANSDFQTARFFFPAVIDRNIEASQSQESAASKNCAPLQGPSVQLSCAETYGARYHPVLGLAPANYSWCMLAPQYHSGPLKFACPTQSQAESCGCDGAAANDFPAGAHGQLFNVVGMIQSLKSGAKLSTIPGTGANGTGGLSTIPQ